MRIINVQQNTPEWFKEREGFFTGTKVSKVVGSGTYLKTDLVNQLTLQGADFNPKDTIANLAHLLDEEHDYQLFKNGTKKIGFYRVAAERLFDPETEEDARNRGHRLEVPSIERFMKETGKKVTLDVGICVSDENESIRVSPDGLIYEDEVVTEAVEAKNFEDAHHLEAVYTNKIPTALWGQVIQYFVVIETLKKLHVLFHTDRTRHPKLQYHVITVDREDIKDKIDEQLDLQKKSLRLIDEIVEGFTF